MVVSQESAIGQLPADVHKCRTVPQKFGGAFVGNGQNLDPILLAAPGQNSFNVKSLFRIMEDCRDLSDNASKWHSA